MHQLTIATSSPQNLMAQKKINGLQQLLHWLTVVEINH